MQLAFHESYLYIKGFGNSVGPTSSHCDFSAVKNGDGGGLLETREVSLCPPTAAVETQGILVNEVFPLQAQYTLNNEGTALFLLNDTTSFRFYKSKSIH